MYICSFPRNVCGKIHHRTEHHVRRNIFGRAKLMACNFPSCLYPVYGNSSKLLIMQFTAVMPYTSRKFRRLVRNLKGGINSDWQDTRTFPINTECKNCHQQELKNYTTFSPHAFRAKGDSRVSRVPCGRLGEGAPRQFIQITIHLTWHQVTRLF